MCVVYAHWRRLPWFEKNVNPLTNMSNKVGWRYENINQRCVVHPKNMLPLIPAPPVSENPTVATISRKPTHIPKTYANTAVARSHPGTHISYTKAICLTIHFRQKINSIRRGQLESFCEAIVRRLFLIPPVVRLNERQDGGKDGA